MYIHPTVEHTSIGHKFVIISMSALDSLQKCQITFDFPAITFDYPLKSIEEASNINRKIFNLVEQLDIF
jgi:hypothetical protein